MADSTVVITRYQTAPTINSGRITGLLVPGALESAYEVAAAYAAVIASEEDPAMPLNTLGLTGISAPALASRCSGGTMATIGSARSGIHSRPPPSTRL